MGLDVFLYDEDDKCVYSANITHNLAPMAEAAGVLDACWFHHRANVTTAADLIPLLEKGIEELKARPDHYKSYDAPWGIYDHFVPWLEKYLAACKEHPTARVEASG